MLLDLRALERLFLAVAVLGASLALGSSPALADACTDLGNCQLFQGECWCEVPADTSHGEVCGHPTDYIGAYYSLNGLESADGCENPDDPESFMMPCPAVAGVADGDRARTIINSLGLTPFCADPGDCSGDCATNQIGFAADLSCWDNSARWSRVLPGFARCTNAEPLTLCEASLDASNAQLADGDGDGVTDLRDACANSASGAEVDASGCDLAQFCASFDPSEKTGKKSCKKADWQNDEPLQKGKERDCQIDKNGRGSADDACIPA